MASSQLASHISARGADCNAATAVVLGAKSDRSGAAYDVLGFACQVTSTAPTNSNFFFHFECEKPGARISFDAQPSSP